MKFSAGFLAAIGCGIALVASATGATGSSGAPSFEIAWAVSTNDWPERLWSYKVAPQDFSPAVVSNLLALSDFTMNDQTNMLNQPLFRDKSILYFRNTDQSKHLEINPAAGWIEYNDRKAEASSQLQTVQGVPNEAEATRLGLKVLRLVGIEDTQIARKSGSDILDLHWEKGTFTYPDPKSKTEITVTNDYGVLFDRCIDGIKVHGFGRGGGVTVTFGNDARITDLRVSWRKLEPYALRDFPSPRQIDDRLKQGGIVLHPLGSRSTYSAKQLKKLAITKITFLYEGRWQDEPMEFCHPFVSFEGIADNGQETTGVWFECRP